jgi:hypothetical protein
MNCHAAGGFSEDTGCMVVMRSAREDDHSKPQLQALKAAASQLSGSRPGIIAIQYEDIEARDLTLPHLRRRATLLDNVVFHDADKRFPHVAGIFHCAFGGLTSYGGAIHKPAFMSWNPLWKGPLDEMPFREGLVNSELARRLEVDPSETDPDDHLYGAGL